MKLMGMVPAPGGEDPTLPGKSSSAVFHGPRGGGTENGEPGIQIWSCPFSSMSRLLTCLKGDEAPLPQEDTLLSLLLFPRRTGREAAPQGGSTQLPHEPGAVLRDSEPKILAERPAVLHAGAHAASKALLLRHLVSFCFRKGRCLFF